MDVAGARVLAILTRAPGAGGKSRLFAELGLRPDPALLTALLLDTREAAEVPGVVQVIAVEPADRCDEVRAEVPATVGLLPQWGGSLGERMHALMADLFARGARMVALVGSDLPDLSTAAVQDAFAHLDRHPASLVLGPARDGGYYLLAATTPPDIFTGIDWGTGRVLEQTVGAARRAGLTVHLLEPCDDVDTAADLARTAAPRTRAWALGHGLSRQTDGRFPEAAPRDRGSGRTDELTIPD